ncbi:MAG: NAD-dependent dihydropyrimidine dehydrogenase subunit PreA [Lachnospiraceae bacterium]|nr:NAD-dependent dihydropyrimidine dehydrogenase subunit PreA [Lachnospiraceae bacterium]
MAYEEIILREESSRCLLCIDASCEKACPEKYRVSDAVRSVRFENIDGALTVVDASVCAGCEGYCEKSCRRADIDRPIGIKSIFRAAAVKAGVSHTETVRADLSVTSMGVRFENPFLLSSSVIGSNYEMVAKAFRMGWAGVAFKTIGMFIPEETSPRFAALSKEENTFVGFKNLEQISDHSLEENLGFLKRLKEEFPTKVIIASIMGRDEEEWTKLAELVEEAGADIIECNFSCPQMVGEGLGSDVGTDPDLVRRYTAAVKKGSRLPVLAKMTPNITRMEKPAEAAVRAGADGIAAINTIKSIMNVSTDDGVSAPAVRGRSAESGYSGKAVKPIALRFIRDLASDSALRGVPISGMGGIETWRDAYEFIALGCDTVQITTAVMQYGYRIIDDLKDGLSRYLASRNTESVRQLKGSALDKVVPADELDRSSVEYPRFITDRCVGCGRCYLSCYDGGHQSITMHPKTKKPVMDPTKCVGCQLCVLVCPADAIEPGVRRQLSN